MYIVSPLSRCASVEKRDRFFNYIANIAPVTYKNEPDCIGYAWFRSTKDNDTIPLHWCRGFEVYRTPEASRVAHRASEQYKAFRHAVGTEALLESPSDLEFWRSTDIGFLTKDGLSMFSPKKTNEELQYIVTDELAVSSAKIDALLEQLRKIAETARLESSIETCWVLIRDLDGHESGFVDNNVYVLLRLRSRAAYELYQNTISLAEWDMVGQLAVKRRTTTWEDAGIGFLGKR